MKSSVRVFYVKIIVCCLTLFATCNGKPIQAAETNNEDTYKVNIFQQTIDDLERAIKTKDFIVLNVGNTERKPLFWGTCDADNRVSLSFNEIIDKLSKLSKNTNIIVNTQPERLFDVTAIETKAWKGDHPYIYFEFKKGEMGWRWLGIRECASRSNVFRDEQGNDLLGGNIVKDKSVKISSQDAKRLNNFVVKFNKIITSKDFKLLETYMPNKKVYTWGPCGPGDGSHDEMSFNKITKMLLESSKNVAIYFNPKATVSGDNASIETEGWTGEWPFLTFSFDFLEKKNMWVLNGACYSDMPSYETKREGKYVATYFREPQLPRPGPRVFKNYSSLRARIEEIVRFKAFDALKPYATKSVLVFGQCNLSMMENDRIEGKSTSVQDVINYLKQHAPAGSIVSSGMQHKTYYETVEWSGDYPFVSFWFSESSKGWELAGVSYCKTKHFDLFPPLSPFK